MNIPDPNETLTIFGREVKQVHPGTTAGWETAIGPLLKASVEPWPQGGFGAHILARPFGDEQECGSCGRLVETEIMWSLVFDAKEEAARWVEDEARKLLGESVQACGGEVTWAAKQNGEAL